MNNRLPFAPMQWPMTKQVGTVLKGTVIFVFWAHFRLDFLSGH
jgi:hypothetical protein